MKWRLTFGLLFTCFLAYPQTPEELVDKQLQGYNNRNIQEFLIPYSDSVKIYLFPGNLLYEGKEKLFIRYKLMFDRNKELHAKLESRQVLGNVVIDKEHVHFNNERDDLDVFVIYKIQSDKIQEVHFLYPD